ncbi:hypothetical protein ACFQY0_01410 [Haloferula chungangensis]|uniref:Outer membrane protein beta-barrel domain-containing protein n=1 Tax=Haloferula chungangensis TaxID=1048331 RepID=A0ABW2L3B3_9BACT
MKENLLFIIFATAASPGVAWAGDLSYPSAGTTSTISSVDSESEHCFGLGIQAGIQGIGLHARYDINPWLYMKIEGNYFKYDDTFDVDGTDYHGDLDLSNIGLTANFLPFNNGFRVTLGGYFGNNEASGVANGNGQTVSIGNSVYTLTQGDQLQGSVEYNQFAPYLGIGWDFGFGSTSSWVFGIDLGVLYLGEPDTLVSASGPITSVPGFGADLAAEQAIFADDINDYQFLPVLKLSLTYRF